MSWAFEPIHHHHHKEVEDPHFHEIREAWELVRRGVEATLDRLKTSGEIEEDIVERMQKVENEESGVVEEVAEEIEEVEVNKGGVTDDPEKEVEKTEITEEGGDNVEIVEVAVKVEIKEDEIELLIEEIKHVEVKERDIVVVEVEGQHHKKHKDDLSPLDSGSENESENEEKRILEYELKEVEAKA